MDLQLMQKHLGALTDEPDIPCISHPASTITMSLPASTITISLPPSTVTVMVTKTVIPDVTIIYSVAPCPPYL